MDENTFARKVSERFPFVPDEETVHVVRLLADYYHAEDKPKTARKFRGAHERAIAMLDEWLFAAALTDFTGHLHYNAAHRIPGYVWAYGVRIRAAQNRVKQLCNCELVKGSSFNAFVVLWPAEGEQPDMQRVVDSAIIGAIQKKLLGGEEGA